LTCLAAGARKPLGQSDHICRKRRERSARPERCARVDGFVAWAGEATPDLEEAARAASVSREPDEALIFLREPRPLLGRTSVSREISLLKGCNPGKRSFRASFS
jgi:hypothetical protein